MIYQECPRRNAGSYIDPAEGFYVEGNTREECIEELKDYCNSHKEKWVYYYNMGMAPASPVPVAKYLFEVAIFDEEPASTMLFCTLFQRGSEGKREIDSMSKEERDELLKKKMKALYILGSMHGGKK